MIGCVLKHLCTTEVIAENCLHVDAPFDIAYKGKFQQILDDILKKQTRVKCHLNITSNVPAQDYVKLVAVTDLETEDRSPGFLAIFTNHEMILPPDVSIRDAIKSS